MQCSSAWTFAPAASSCAPTGSNTCWRLPPSLCGKGGGGIVMALSGPNGNINGGPFLPDCAWCSDSGNQGCVPAAWGTSCVL
jgi:hypothetical protein